MKSLVLLAFVATWLGCATAKPVITACAPARAQETAIVLATLDDPTLTNVIVTARLEASGVALCVITELAREALATVKLETAGPSVRRLHSRAWLDAHPR